MPRPDRAERIATLRRAFDILKVGASLESLFSEAEDWVEVEPGEVLARQGDTDRCLFLLVDGKLDVQRAGPAGETESPDVVATLEAPQIVGEMQLLTGGVRIATLRAATACSVLRIPGQAFEREDSGELLAALARLAEQRLRLERLRRILPSFLGASDPALSEELAARVEWLSLRSGEVLVREGDPGGDVFFLLDGRMRATLPSAGDRAIGDLVPGDIVGEAQLFTGGVRNATVVATRASVLACLTRADLAAAMRRDPDLGMRLAGIAVERARSAVRPRAAVRASFNVVVTGARGAGLAREVAQRLTAALARHGAVELVSRECVERGFGQPGLCDVAESDPRAARLHAWLADQEAGHRFLVFVPDASDSAWARRCRERADLALIVAERGAAPSAAFAAEPNPVRHWLVLVHEGEHRAFKTAAWRQGLEIERFFHLRQDSAADFARLSRAIAGREIGLVLGGGGARGYAHLGTIRAMQQLGIPVDVLGGTSVGAAVSGYYALGYRDQALEAVIRRVFGGWVGYTLPVVSLSSGKGLLRRMREVFGEVDFEDLPLPVFCIATDISGFGMLTIDRGPVCDAVLASASLPGIFPPVNLGGRWAVDGGLVDAVPADVMRAMVGPSGTVIASDVTGGGAATPPVKAPPGAQAMSGWRLLARTLAGQRAQPAIAEVLSRAATAAGDHQLQQVLATAYPDVCIRHDTAGHSVVDFSDPAPLREKGYQASMRALEPLVGSGKLPPLS